ncbi:MAG: 1-acyl-sn-glycerol-3-phosphate acyltransferase [Erysipelotrichales bacterium]|nr:1-acyl-sn-glycerol-3-phosphate acyltransferase [Erysipelotrichales bacterium]
MDNNEIKNDDEKIQSGQVEHSFQNIKAKKVVLPDDYPFFQKGFFHLIAYFFVARIMVSIAYFYAYIFMGLKVKGKKNKKLIKKKGCIVISNHIHPWDSYILVGKFLPRRLFATSLQSNLGLPIIGKIIELCGAVPIPEKREQYPKFLASMSEALKKGKKVLVYPEGSLNLYSQEIKPFKKGAVRFATENASLILPCCFTFRNPGFIRRIFLFRKKPLITLHYLPPYQVETLETKAETISQTTINLYDIINEHFQKHNNFKPKNS